MEKNRVNTKFLMITAMVAAIYTVLTLMIAPLSFGLVQVRFSEMLMLLAFVDRKYAPGLILGVPLTSAVYRIISEDMKKPKRKELIG